MEEKKEIRKTKQRVQIYMPVDLVEDLTVFGKEKGLSRNKMGLEIIKKWLEEKVKNRELKEGIGGY